MARLTRWQPTPSSRYQRHARDIARRLAAGELTQAEHDRQVDQAHQAWLREWPRRSY